MTCYCHEYIDLLMMEQNSHNNVCLEMARIDLNKSLSFQI